MWKIARTLLIILAIMATGYFLFWLPLRDMAGPDFMPSVDSGNPTQTNAPILATNTKLPESTIAILATPTPPLRVTVIMDKVNLRDGNLNATGKWLVSGTVLEVKIYALDDHYYQIVVGEYAGDLIWSGCTSMCENRTCQSK